MSHFSLHSPTPFGLWQPNARNPVVTGGQLWSKICAGAGKHCPVAMVDEGTPQIVDKVRWMKTARTAVANNYQVVFISVLRRHAFFL